MSRFDVVVDIESYEDISDEMFEMLKENVEVDGRLKDPQKIIADMVKKEAAIRDKAALSPLTGRVVMAGVGHWEKGKLVIEQAMAWPPNVVKQSVSDVACCDNESHLLRWLMERISMPNTRIITFNGRDFDLPFLAARCMLHSVKPPECLPVMGSDRYERHIDLLDVLGHGKLTLWSRLMLGVVKDDSDVAAMVRDGRWTNLADRNRQDIECTAGLFERMRDVVAL